MGGRLSGQVVWISGAASGMGEATARLFAAEGAAVAIVDVQTELGEALAQDIAISGGRARFIRCDVRREAEVQASIDATAREFGALTTIVNCAGIVHVKLLHEYSEAEWD